MKLAKNLVITSVACMAFGVSISSHAYTLYKCNDQNVKWSGEAATMRLASNSFPSDSSYTTAITEVINDINKNTSDFKYTISTASGNAATQNGVNEIYFKDGLEAVADAVLYWNCSNARFTEADVRFRSGLYTSSKSITNSWKFINGVSGAKRPFRPTAVHELGHALGLGHTSDTYSAMGQDWTHIHHYGGDAEAYLGEDGSAGARALYGADTGNPDYSVTTFRRTGKSGEYSTHGVIAFYNSNDTRITSTFEDSDGAVGYQVSKGQTIKVEFGLESFGERNTSVRNDVYLSDNRTISSSDTLLKTNHSDLGTNTVYYGIRTITLPSNLTSGDVYYIGVIIDRDNEVAERDETNNKAYVPIKIK